MIGERCPGCIMVAVAILLSEKNQQSMNSGNFLNSI